MLLRLTIVMAVIFGSLAPVFAGGAPEKETEVILRRPPVYISPGHPATGKDTLTIQNVQLDIDPQAAIKRYDLKIYDKSGQVIYLKTDSNLQGRGFLGDLFKVGEIPSVKVPATMTWPGVDIAGKIVADGEYFYQLTVLDSNGKKASTPPLAVVVDTVVPEIISAGSNWRTFSPNGDGVRDTITFTHRTGAAYQWIEEILDDKGQVVWTKTTTAPGDTASTDEVLRDDIIWDGVRNTGGTGTIGEGTFTYRLTAADRANNRFQKTVEFKMSLSGGDVALDAKTPAKAYKPSGQLTLLPRIKDTKGLSGWEVRILDGKDIVQRVYKGTGQPPAEVFWNFKGNPGRPETEGDLVKDGAYTGLLRATYDSGAVAESEPLPLTVKGTPPFVGVEADSKDTPTQRDRPLVFGTAKKSKLAIRVVTEPGPAWVLVVRTREGAPVFQAPVRDLFGAGSMDKGREVFNLLWDGTLPDKSGVLADGNYVAEVRGTDEAGNEGRSNPVGFIRDTKQGLPLTVTLSDTILAPGGTGSRGKMHATYTIPQPEGINGLVSQVIKIDGDKESIVRSQFATQAVPGYDWTGINEAGNPVEEGTYLIRLSINYLSDETVTGQSPVFKLSRQVPSATAKAKSSTFSPNGDGVQDTLVVSQTSSEETDWSGIFTDAKGAKVKELHWKGKAPDFVWDGKRDDGSELPDGKYAYTLRAVNALGNEFSTKIDPVRIDRLSDTIGVVAKDTLITPNGDSQNDTGLITLRVQKPADLVSWKLDFVAADAKIGRSQSGTKTLPADFRWDGRGDGGASLEGSYTPTLSVTYKDGKTAVREADDPILVYSRGPLVGVSVADQGTPADLTAMGTYAIHPTVRDGYLPVAGWQIQVLDPAGHPFRTWKGTGAIPKEVVWDGKSDKGEVVQSALEYTITVRAQDKNGVAATAMEQVTTGITFEKTAQGYRVSLIFFAGDTPDLFADNWQAIEKNLVTLRKLHTLLDRLPEYRISIVGHAAHLRGPDPKVMAEEERTQLLPLSNARALEVRQALTILGIPWTRMDSTGVGGTQPTAPFNDVENRWKNRRVEFLLSPGSK